MNKDKLKQATCKPVLCNLPKTGIDVHMRRLSVKEMGEVYDTIKANEAGENKEPIKHIAKVAQMLLVNEDGSPSYPENEFDELCQVSAGVLLEVMNIGLALNTSELDNAKKN